MALVFFEALGSEQWHCDHRSSASGSRDQRLRSGFHWTAADSFLPHRIRNHSQQARISPSGITTENTNNRPGLKPAARIRAVDHGIELAHVDGCRASCHFPNNSEQTTS